jgi:hypothetical protein
MKTSIIVLAAFALSGSVGASQLPNPLLIKTKSNVTVSPQHQWTSTCKVFSNEVVSQMRGSYADPTPVRKQVKWTSDIKNSRDVNHLIKTALKTKSNPPMPGVVGGTYSKWEAVQTKNAGAPYYSTLLTSGGMIEKNPSAAAKKLVNFLESNCNQ